MGTEQDLIQKLMISKKIMDKHNQTPRSINSNVNTTSPEVQSFNKPNASYNIPNDMNISGEQTQNLNQPYLSEASIPKQSSGEITEDKILNSKLPDEIKKL